MNINRELKLAIYESSLDNEDKEDLLNIVESTDDEEILCDVVDILEAQSDYPYVKKLLEQAKQTSRYAHEVKSTPKRERKWKGKEAAAKQGAEYLDINNALNTIATDRDYKGDLADRLNQPRREYDEEVSNINKKYLTTKKREQLLKNAKLKKDIKDNIVRKQSSGGRIMGCERQKQMYGKKANIFNDAKNGDRERYFAWDNNTAKLTKIGNKMLESVLEAYKEGYFTEDEVIELLSE